MRFLRMYKGDEHGAPGVTLYEVDSAGWVHRQLQVHAEGVRFSPEDILLRRPINVESMVDHPDAEEITGEEFELYWAEFDHRRRFRERIPNPWRAWAGRLLDGPRVRELHWIPSGAHPGNGWVRVPGFTSLYVNGDASTAWAAQRELFLEHTIEWDAVIPGAVYLTAPAREIIDGPGLAGALHDRASARPGLAVALA